MAFVYAEVVLEIVLDVPANDAFSAMNDKVYCISE